MVNLNIPDVNVSPTLGTYTGQGAFRFWCQKVLPLVYDDSLSYYELLNKVVVYLNNVISDMSAVENNMTAVADSFDELEDYVNRTKKTLVDSFNELNEFVNDYFTNLDVQNEINEKLDEMAADGTLTTLLSTVANSEIPGVVTDWLEENVTPTSPIVDASLSIQGAAADAKAVGDALAEIRPSSGEISGELKAALLQLAQKVAYIDDGGQDYYADLYSALYSVESISLNTNSVSLTNIGGTSQLSATTVPAGMSVVWSTSNASVATVSDNGLVTAVGHGSAIITATCGNKQANCSVVVSELSLTSISAVYNQTSIVYDSASLESLKTDLTVTALWSDSTETTISGENYTLSGTLEVGTSIITVSYGGKTATFNVTVTASPTISSISAVYTQSGTVYDNDTLDSLKSDLVVNANFTDQTSVVVPSSDYTLSGTLTTGTSTITVSYSGQTTTFNVTVTHFVITLDTVVYEGKSYRDIFITGNQLHGFGFESGVPSGCTVYAGSPEISSEDAYGGSYSLKAFGSSSAQYRSTNTENVSDWNKYSGVQYFTAFKAKCTRYTAGNLGISVNNGGLMPTGLNSISDGWVTCHKYITGTGGATNGYGYIGSYSSANLDGYLDDIVIIPMTNIFTNVPSESDILSWYNQFCDLLKGGAV